MASWSDFEVKKNGDLGQKSTETARSNESRLPDSRHIGAFWTGLPLKTHNRARSFSNFCSPGRTSLTGFLQTIQLVFHETGAEHGGPLSSPSIFPTIRQSDTPAARAGGIFATAAVRAARATWALGSGGGGGSNVGTTGVVWIVLVVISVGQVVG